MRSHILHHIILPAIVPALFCIVAALPVEVQGCRNRGLLAVAIALIGALAGLGAVIVGTKGRTRNDANALWWGTSASILAIPAGAVIIIAYAG